MGLAGSNPGRVRPLSGVSPAVVPFPKGGGCYAEIHKIHYLCYSHSNSFYIKSKITAPLDKVLAAI